MNFELHIEPHFTFFLDNKKFAWLERSKQVLTQQGHLLTWKVFLKYYTIDKDYQEYLEHVYSISCYANGEKVYLVE